MSHAVWTEVCTTKRSGFQANLCNLLSIMIKLAEKDKAKQQITSVYQEWYQDNPINSITSTVCMWPMTLISSPTWWEPVSVWRTVTQIPAHLCPDSKYDPVKNPGWIKVTDFLRPHLISLQLQLCGPLISRKLLTLWAASNTFALLINCRRSVIFEKLLLWIGNQSKYQEVDIQYIT